MWWSVTPTGVPNTEEKELRRVRKLLKRTESRFPKDPYLHNAYGRFFRRTREPNLVYQAFEEARQLSSIRDYPSPWLNLAAFYADFDFWAKVEYYASSVLLSHPEDPRAISLIEHYHKAESELALAFGLQYPPNAAGDKLLLKTLQILAAMHVKVKGVKLRLKDNIGLTHEIDILCETSVLPGEPIPFVIECKDWSRAIARPVVDQFRSFLDHSRYRLGLIVVSNEFTDGARIAAAESGILIKTVAELEEIMHALFLDRLKVLDLKDRRVRDHLADGGIGEDENVRRATAAIAFIELATRQSISADPRVVVDRHGLYFDGEVLREFDEGEFASLERTLGDPKESPMLLLLLSMSWWTCVKLNLWLKCFGSGLERRSRRSVAWLCGGTILLLLLAGFLWWWSSRK